MTGNQLQTIDQHLAVRDEIAIPAVIGSEDFAVAFRTSRAFNADLIAESKLGPLLDQIEAALLPCDEMQAYAICSVMLGAYTRHDIAEPSAWIDGMVSLMMEYPAHVCMSAADRLTRRLKWVPQRAEMAEALAVECAPLNTALANALWMRSERARRKAEAEREAAVAADHAKFRAKFEAQFGKAPEDCSESEFARLLRSMSSERANREATENGRTQDENGDEDQRKLAPDDSGDRASDRGQRGAGRRAENRKAAADPSQGRAARRSRKSNKGD